MSSFSEFFGRKGGASAAEKFSPLSPAQGPTPEERPLEGWADIGARIGSDNEALRNLLPR